VDAAKRTKARLVIVDDQEANVALLEQMLERSGYANVVSTTDSKQAVAMCTAETTDLLLLDLHMPDPDGFAVMDGLAGVLERDGFPILVVTADVTSDAKRRALTQGARDFVGKPFDQPELLARIHNLLEVRFLQLELEERNASLAGMVERREQELSDARLEIVDRLALAADYRDDDTGEHTQRVGRTAGLIAERLGLPGDMVELIRHAAPMHDIGKIGIPDQILLKPGRLTAEEFEVIKSHVEIGGRILSNSASPLLNTASVIALTHHERWDGSGYTAQLSGKQIPVAGRIVAIADVFDALTHDRPYKEAWPIDRALAEIREQSGRQFDPEVVEAFEALDHRALLAPVERGLAASDLRGDALQALRSGGAEASDQLPQR
jgi:putative two-component system response regulator